MNESASNATQPQRFQCRHIHTAGHPCGSPALRHELFCFFHHTARKPIPRAETDARQARAASFDLPLLEDRASIQLAIGEVLRRIAGNALDPRRAGLLLYGLQIASLNLPRQAAPAPERRPRHPEPLFRRHAARQAAAGHAPSRQTGPGHEQDPTNPVEEFVHHPTHGPISKQTPYQDPEEESSPLALLLHQVEDDEEDEPSKSPRQPHPPQPPKPPTTITPAYPPDEPAKPAPASPQAHTNRPEESTILPTLQARHAAHANRDPRSSRRRPPATPTGTSSECGRRC